MGGCNSVFNKLAGGPLGTFATGGFVGFALDKAGVPLPFTQKKGCDKSKNALIKATQEIVATAIVDSLSSCTSMSQADQVISISCRPNLPAGQVYEGNSACGQCNGNVFDGMLAGHAQERKMWATDDPANVRVRLNIDDEFRLLITRANTCGITACKACSLANTTQYNILNSSQDCYGSSLTVANFTNSLENLLTQQLVSNQDVLAGVAAAFGGPANVVNITQNIRAAITQQVNTSFLEQVKTRMQSQQTITLATNGGSVSGNNISQSTTFNVALQAVTENDIIRKSGLESKFDVIEQVINQQTTINAVGEALFTSTITFAKTLDSIVGKVMIAVIVALGLVVVFLLGLAIYRGVKSLIRSDIDNQKFSDISQLNLGTFDRF